jgi:hypothetical protein
MYKKLLLCVATIALSTNISCVASARLGENRQQKKSFLADYPKLQETFKAGGRGGVLGASNAFLVGLVTQDASLKERLQGMLAGGIVGSIAGLITGGISSFLPNSHRWHGMKIFARISLVSTTSVLAALYVLDPNNCILFNR